jgi:hypothetical protein
VRGRIHGSCRDDDYAILGLDLLETHGFAFSTEQVGDLWLLRLPYLHTFLRAEVEYQRKCTSAKKFRSGLPSQPVQRLLRAMALIRSESTGQ